MYSPCFDSCDLAWIYVEYEMISTMFTGWTLSDIRRMPTRERAYWYSVVKKRVSERK